MTKAGSIPTTAAAMKSNPKPKLETTCSPHVRLSSELDRLMASIGPTPSTTIVGTTKKVR